MAYYFHGKCMAMCYRNFGKCHDPYLKMVSVLMKNDQKFCLIIGVQNMSTKPSKSIEPEFRRKSQSSSLNCVISFQKENSQDIMKTCLVDQNGEVKEKYVSTEAPILHDASKKKFFQLQKSFILENGKKNEYSKSSQFTLNEDVLLQKSSTNLFQTSDDMSEVLESPEKILSKTSVLVGSVSSDSLDCYKQKIDLRMLPTYYSSLSKSRLTGFVVLTAMAGYMMGPEPFELWMFLFCSIGTGLTSCAANCFNQVFEVPYDSQMNRTKNRVLVKGLITPLHAAMFGVFCGTVGVSVLWCGVNEITALLGALNILLYSCIYTPLKRISIINTWIGAFVGAIPPLMGWAACTGSLAPGAFLLAGILYAWQFPHFNALSWTLRPDYSKAGYRMMCVTDPNLCRRTALRYSLMTIPISTLCPVLGITTWTFALDSLPLNLYLSYLAWCFYKEGNSHTSRKLFHFSLIHLPVLLVLMIISKKRDSTKDGEESSVSGQSNAVV